MIGAGCSPDGIVVDADGRRGLIEVKCPSSKVHIGYLRAGVLPPAYQAQVTHALWVAGPEDGQFVDFFSFDDRLPEGLQTFLVREWRDEEKMRVYGEAVALFMAEVETEIAALLALREQA